MTNTKIFSIGDYGYWKIGSQYYLKNKNGAKAWMGNCRMTKEDIEKTEYKKFNYKF